MAVFLDERCVAELLTMDDALAAVEEVFREQGRGGVVNVPRVRALKPITRGRRRQRGDPRMKAEGVSRSFE